MICPIGLKVVFCRILGALFLYGYDVVTSTDVARDCQTHCSAFFRLREPQENWKLHAYSHKFICVAPYGADQLLLINIPKTAVEEIYKVSGLTSQKIFPFFQGGSQNLSVSIGHSATLAPRAAKFKFMQPLIRSYGEYFMFGATFLT